MTTTEELRTAMNELAAETPPLHSGDLLRQGRRYRARRRLMAGGGAVAAALGVVVAVNVLPVQLDTAPVPTGTGPVVVATGLAPDDRFVFGKEEYTGSGFRTMITDRQLPPYDRDQGPPPQQAELTLLRWPGETTLAPAPTGGQVRTITVSGVTVRIHEEKSRNGWSRWLDWVDGTNRYSLVVQPYYYRDEVSYGAMSSDLPWIVAKIIERDRGRN
jgi:hypothetical protein